METSRGIPDYSEYNAWLQGGGGVPLNPLHLAPGSGVTETAVSECRDGFVRLYGEDIWQTGAEQTLRLELNPSLPPEGYRLTGNANGLLVEGADANGLLYGVYNLLARLKTGCNPETLNEQSAPAIPRRTLNHWDNVTGKNERGYSGSSIFFKNGKIDYDPKRIREYARLMASVGLNEIAVNNVNVTPESARLVTDMLPRLAELADIFRPFGVRMVISVDFDGPRSLGGLPASDPLDAGVIQWWKDTAARVYQAIPDLAGLLVKADSEFRTGPAALGRTQADGANVIARALKPFGGTVYWRCFVYNCMQDWRDTKTDRPKAAYDHFFPLDGSFDDNVVLQIKNGPMDFQVREPNSPLLGAMKHTRQGLELQITQEYTGQQIDLYSLAVQWQEVLDTPVSETRQTRDLIGREIDSISAVANVGSDENWTGHTLAQANFYAFGRLAWNPGAKASDILDEWVRLTFGNDSALVGPLTGMLMASRTAYEKYTAPLGIGWMVNVNHHYGPSVEGYEFMKWGTYHRANHKAIGVDRTDKGTGFTNQLDPWLAARYNDLTSCPEELVLFFHRLSYDYVLKSGKTLLQHIYDTHFEGVEDVQGFITLWESLKPLLPDSAYHSVRERLSRQLVNAEEWRDVVNTYFYRHTGIPDSHGRKIYE